MSEFVTASESRTVTAHGIFNINTFTNLGIFYSNYVDQEKAKHLTFPTIKTITNEEKK